MTKPLLAGLLSLTLLAAPGDPVRAVNPFIGTGGHGHTYPGSHLPFGMVQLSPDTRLDGWDGCGGYHYSDTRIFGFSHTHLSGTGVSDYGDILLMPMTGEARLNNGADGKPGYASTFSHAEEQASPGYYKVHLRDWDVDAELTSTLRTGLHRYTFPKGKPAHVILDLVHRDEVIESSLRLVNDHEIEGLRRSKAWARDQVVHFVARFSRPFQGTIAEQDVLKPGLRESQGKALKAVLDFGNQGGSVLVKVGISAVDAAGARHNLDAESPGWDFAATRRRAEAAWRGELSKIEIQGGTADQRTIFYTALYHCLLNPNTFDDADGRYRGRDFKIRQLAKGDHQYTVFSLWDTFRGLHPLMTILDRPRTAAFVRTFLRQYQEGGRLPVWELAANETDCMIGYHAVPVIADALAKGIGGFDRELAYEAMKHSAEENRLGIGAFNREGYVPADQEPESVSKTLEYAYDDWCIARTAQLLGKPEEAALWMRRAQGYRHLFDPASGFMRARMEGHWFSPFDPSEVNFNYTEANAWQYSFFAPQDMDGLMALHGGEGPFARKLDALFAAESRIAGNQQADITGMVGQYAHGNEPSHHMAYLYAFAGQPWKTQAMVRRLLNEMYRNDPDGLIGNEDCGQMSAWYVLSALGFYSVTPGTTQYVLGSPLFPRAVIRQGKGRAFTIRAEGADKACYVQSLSLDGRPYHRAFLEHADIARGGELILRMGTQPGEALEPPRTAIPGPALLPLPFVASGEEAFHQRTTVALGDAEASSEIHFTTDGSEPTAASPRYQQPFELAADTVVKALALRPGQPPSPALRAPFHRLPEGRAITLSAKYSRQYSAGGDQALIDGLRGRALWRLGRWQGYQGQDLEAVVDLGQSQPIHRLAMGFMQDTSAWILMPRQVSFAVSEDGRTWIEMGTVMNEVSDKEMAVVQRDFAIAVPGAQARYVRVRVQHYGKLPAWHPGAGEDAFFFADEIVVE